ncbi:MAG: CASTOR/POLLUX-related putative ion channel, partial [Planctomycetota bacterium]
TKLITEVMSSENQELISRAGVNDFIISNRLVSMMLAQMSEEADIKSVYDNLFQEEGSEIYLKPALLYFPAFPAEASFADLMGVAQKRGEICIGIKLNKHEKDMKRNFGVTLIPEKSTRCALQADDCLVVLAEDES